jgi:ribosomal protein S18 acetylase RimI-like enzyme
MDLTIRPAGAKDVPFLRALNRAAYEELAVRVFGSWNDTLKRDKFESKLARGGFRLVVLNGEPVGAILSVDGSGYVTIRDLMILPKFQRRGIGSRVIELEIARATALRKPVRLHTSRLNEARHFYLRHGFVETGGDGDFIDFERAV